METLFGILGLIPDQPNANLNVAFLVLSAVLVVRFLRTGGPAMFRMMDRPPQAPMPRASAEAPMPRPASTRMNGSTFARCTPRS
jgi:uncharacterized protein